MGMMSPLNWQNLGILVRDAMIVKIWQSHSFHIGVCHREFLTTGVVITMFVGMWFLGAGMSDNEVPPPTRR